MATCSYPQIILMLTEKCHKQQKGRVEADKLRFLRSELEQKVLQLQKEKEALRSQKVQLNQQLEHQHTEAKRLRHELAKEQKVRASLETTLAHTTNFLQNILQVTNKWVKNLQPEEEDGNYEIVFQLHCKEILRQLLAMLSSAVVLSPPNIMGPHQHHGHPDSYHRGHWCLEREDWETAVVFFSRAIHLDPQLVEFYALRAEAYIQLCDYSSAVQNLRRAHSFQPENTQFLKRLTLVLYLQGQCLFEQCAFADALNVFSQAFELQPKKPSFRYRCMACLLALRRYQDCLSLVTKEVEYGTTNADIYILRARLYNSMGKPHLCYQDLHSALVLDPKHTQAKVLLKMMVEKSQKSFRDARILAVQGKLQHAVQCVNCAIDNNPLDPSFFLFRGTMYRRLRDFDAAVEDFLKALDMMSEHQEDMVRQAQRQLLLAYNDFALHCYMQGAYQEGVLLLNKVLKDEQREKGLYINRGGEGGSGWAPEAPQGGREEEGKEETVKSLSVPRTHVGKHCLQETGYSLRPAQKSGRWERWASPQSQAPPALWGVEKAELGSWTLGWGAPDCFFQLGYLNFAEADYQEALTLSPSDEGANLRMSLLQEKMGCCEHKSKQFQKAESHFTLAIQHNPQMAQYYLHRARSRQFIQNIFGARQDVATALILDPKQPKLLSLITILFPGMSMEEVLGSQVGLLAKMQLSRVIESRRKDNISQGIMGKLYKQELERQKARTLQLSWKEQQVLRETKPQKLDSKSPIPQEGPEHPEEAVDAEKVRGEEEVGYDMRSRAKLLSSSLATAQGTALGSLQKPVPYLN
ncbi:Tetratricopeptide repeat protein 16 [Myotis brandtii]|uniref:Tetratricopeptide repeat protein 16 n=1 Tax=Myotis brandtii TaxID=109478 RepID=S7Q1N0_MYOBR|nr:Tetratricopeptide repeat protein 16 [Myotis brandtii]